MGRIGNIAWELEIDPGREMIKPDIFPAALLHMTDLTLVSAPLARFTGWIRHGGQQYKLESSHRMLSHYSGRQLSSEWWWISANQFDQAGVSLEFAWINSNIWGTRFKMPIAYLYLVHEDKREFVTLLSGMATVKGTQDNFEVSIKRFGKEPVTLVGKGREYGNLGEGIVNTLVGVT